MRYSSKFPFRGQGLINCFSLPVLKILKYKCSQLIQRCKKCFSIVRFREFLYKPLQVRICGDHKGRDRYL